ncbi:MAG: TIGR01777 family oxidoreductase [Gemmatimonadota bacterium]|nr:TIGR01777 family oxidoreductase [Gemmatimonadota bacterium]
MPSPSTTIERSVLLPASVEDAFAWHERPGALERLWPPWERLEVLEQSGGIRDGGRAVFRVRAGPASFRWVARHRDYLPSRQFTDEQLEGPFSQWTHLHRFEPAGARACRLTDRVEYRAPFGILGRAAAPWLVRPRLERMFDYRHALLGEDLAAHAGFPDARLHVAVTGASGLLGSSLVPFLSTGGHRVTRLVRGAPREGELRWDPAGGQVDAAELEGVDAVVHLAGENVGARWTRERKRRIRESRADGTRVLAETLARMRRPPRVLVSASAIGVYGDRGSEILTEMSPPPGASSDFLVAVGTEWEAATEPARAAGIRVVLLRFGIILTPAGGALGRMLPAFRLGGGGPLGSGDQWMSWIAIDDAAGAVHHALLSDSLEGPVNATAPEPVTNREFAATLGRVLGRPALVPVPGAALRLAFGEMADVALLGSQRVIPRRLVEAGYRHRHPALEGALRFLLGRQAAAS